MKSLQRKFEIVGITDRKLANLNNNQDNSTVAHASTSKNAASTASSYSNKEEINQITDNNQEMFAVVIVNFVQGHNCKPV